MTTDPEALAALAADVAPALVGLTPAQAEQRLADTDEQLSVRFAGPDDAVTLEFRYGRITAVLVDGVIERATAG